jgi:CRP-like cAMP-binding protein
MLTNYQFEPAIALGKAALEELVGSCQVRRFGDGALIQQHGELLAGMWVVRSGEVVIGRLDRDGGMTTYALLGPGALFGELAYFAGVPRQVDVFARGVTELVWIDDRAVRPLLERRPEVALVLLRSLARQLADALRLIDQRRRMPLPARLAQILCARARPDAEGRLLVRATQQELADLAGVSRVAIVAALGRLAARGLVARGYGAVILSDRASLAEIASGALA